MKTKAEKVDQRFQNAQNRARGAWFEKLIDSGCVYYRTQGIADIEKTPEPMKVLRPMGQGRFLAAYTAAAQADYKGLLTGGRAVYFEAKSTDTDRMLQSRVTPNQAERLQRAYQMGALVFVLCEIRDRYYRIPWEHWCRMKEKFGHKYLTQEDADKHDWTIRIGPSAALLFLEGICK